MADGVPLECTANYDHLALWWATARVRPSLNSGDERSPTRDVAARAFEIGSSLSL